MHPLGLIKRIYDPGNKYKIILLLFVKKNSLLEHITLRLLRHYLTEKYLEFDRKFWYSDLWELRNESSFTKRISDNPL